jgi:hypothetical protein
MKDCDSRRSQKHGEELPYRDHTVQGEERTKVVASGF